MDIYCFGSLARGEIDTLSDVDILIVDPLNRNEIDTNYSVYSFSRLEEMWSQGNPFAWHLFLESRLLFSTHNLDTVKKLSMPKEYSSWESDSFKFETLFFTALNELKGETNSFVFELSNLFLAIRNFATCASFMLLDRPVFSRRSYSLLGEFSLKLKEEVEDTLINSRILATRGKGRSVTHDDVFAVLENEHCFLDWFDKVKRRISDG